jgi:hypothetical protein
LFALVAVPDGVTTLIFPVVAPAGTTAPIRVDDLTVKLALTPLNLTEVAPVKFVPLIFTVLPTEPLAGVKLVIVGGPIAVGVRVGVAVGATAVGVRVGVGVAVGGVVATAVFE